MQKLILIEGFIATFPSTQNYARLRITNIFKENPLFWYLGQLRLVFNEDVPSLYVPENLVPNRVWHFSVLRGSIVKVSFAIISQVFRFWKQIAQQSSLRINFSTTKRHQTLTWKEKDGRISKLKIQINLLQPSQHDSVCLKLAKIVENDPDSPERSQVTNQLPSTRLAEQMLTASNSSLTQRFLACVVTCQLNCKLYWTHKTSC